MDTKTAYYRSCTKIIKTNQEFIILSATKTLQVSKDKKNITSSVHDCTVEDVE